MATFDPAQLEALGAAVSEGTFDAAARLLHVTPSAVSQRIKALESSVGRVLLTRSKPVTVTESGQAVLRLARQIELLSADTAREIGSGPVSTGPVAIRLGVNADSLSTWFLPALAAAGDGVVFDLHRDDQERTADLLRDGTVMAAVTAAADPVPGCTVQRLGRMRYRPRCTPAFARRWFPDGVSAAALAVAPVVEFDHTDTLQAAFLRRRSRRRLDPPRHFVPGSVDFTAAVRLGIGWGMVPDLQTTDDLVELEPDSHADVTLFWQQWKLRSPALDRVADAVRAAAAGLR